MEMPVHDGIQTCIQFALQPRFVDVEIQHADNRHEYDEQVEREQAEADLEGVSGDIGGSSLAVDITAADAPAPCSSTTSMCVRAGS